MLAPWIVLVLALTYTAAVLVAWPPFRQRSRHEVPAYVVAVVATALVLADALIRTQWVTVAIFGTGLALSLVNLRGARRRAQERELDRIRNYPF